MVHLTISMLEATGDAQNSRERVKPTSLPAVIIYLTTVASL